MQNRPYLHHSNGIASVALLALVALAGTVCVVLQGKHGEENTPHAVVDGIYAGRAPGWEVKIEVPQQLTIGKEETRIAVHTARPGKLYLIQAGTDGKSLDLIFPNALDADNLVPAGDTSLPRDTWRFAAAGPAGTGELLAVVTPNPVSESAIRAALAQRRQPDMGAEYGAARASWVERNP